MWDSAQTATQSLHCQFYPESLKESSITRSWTSPQTSASFIKINTVFCHHQTQRARLYAQPQKWSSLLRQRNSPLLYSSTTVPAIPEHEKWNRNWKSCELELSWTCKEEYQTIHCHVEKIFISVRYQKETKRSVYYLHVIHHMNAILGASSNWSNWEDYKNKAIRCTFWSVYNNTSTSTDKLYKRY